MLNKLTLKDTLVDAAREVFETMVFMEVETDSEAYPLINGPSLLSSITFKGCIEGCLAVCVDNLCAQQIAKNMLGAEPDETLKLEEVCDAIGEIANMIMGSIKTRLHTVYPLIEVSIPSVITGRELKNTLGEKAVSETICARLNEQDAIEISLLFRELNTEDAL